MKNIYSRAFTIIELLVVIAIIGILASTVLANLGNMRDKGSDAKIKQQISSIKSAAELFSISAGSYKNMDTVTDTDTSGLFELEKADNWTGSVPPTIVVKADGTAWAAYHALMDDITKAFCIDSTGASKEIDITTSGTTGTFAVTAASPTCK
jgi:prepilin-type N-terminal cleavage/methylation domain-containing protein